MALQLGALRDALIAGGTPPDKADKAAEEGAQHLERLGKIEGDLMVLKWMVATVLAGVVALLIKAFTLP